MATEQIVIMFTDIVGSTELSWIHSPDEADEVRRTHFAILRDAIEQTGGTQVKGMGDGVMAVFNAASAAMACAVLMQQGVELDNRRHEHTVGLRVGMSAGEAVCDDDDYYGDAVIEAARLCSICEPGQVLAADVVRLVAGRRSPQHCRPIGALRLKGLPYPVEAIEVVWEPLDSGLGRATIPLPERLTVRPDYGILGRAAELDTLAEVIREAEAGERRQIALVAGEAGLGKTTLVAEAARQAFDLGACVLFGHCEESLATPYQLFAEALTHYVTHAPEDKLLAHVETYGSELSRLVPALARRIPGLPPSRAADPDSERFLLFAAVIGLLTDVSADQAIVLVLDDIQWADKTSLLLLQHLAAAALPMRVAVFGTYRDNELSPTHPLLETFAAFHRQGNVARIELTGMDPAGVVAFIEAVTGYQLDDTEIEMARAVHRETDGNPFFVTEVLRHLRDTGAVTRDESGKWSVVRTLEEMALPDSVRDVVGARIGRLGADAARVLGVASVIGRDFDLDLLAGASGIPVDALLDLLDAAAGVALIRELSDTPGRYNFTHALIQHAVYQDLGPTRQAVTHRAVAVALEQLCGDRPELRINELARHWCTSPAPADVPRAIDYARAAGDAALRALAPADALRYYTTAVELSRTSPLSDPLVEVDVAIGRGTAQRQTGDPAYRETLLDASRRAAELGDTPRLVRGVLANDRGWASASGTVDMDKVALIELALERLSPHHPSRALVLGTLCAELAFGSTLEHRQALANEALAIAEAGGDDATIARLLNHLVFPLLVPSLLDQSLAWSGDALTRAERVGDPVLLYFAAIYRGDIAIRAGDIAEVDRCYAIARPLAEALNQPNLNWEYAFHLAKRAQVTGDTEAAERLATEALQIGTECGQPDAATFFGAQLAVVQWQRGTMGDLTPLIEQMIVDSPGLPTLKAALAMAYAQGERFDDARRVIDDFAATGFDLPQDSAWLNGMTEYASAAIMSADTTHAAALFALLEPWADQFSSAGGVTAEGPVSGTLGGLAALLGHHDLAERYLEQASAFSNRVGATFFGAEADLLRGQMLTARDAPGDAELALTSLRRAHTVAVTHGYGGIERRASVALVRLGATPE